MLFLINVVIAVATLWNAYEDHGTAVSAVRSANDGEKAKNYRKLLLLWLVPMLSLAGLPLTWLESTTSERKIADTNERASNAYKLAGEANERASSNEIARAELQIELNKTRADLIKLEPQSQRLVSLSATVMIHTPEDLEYIKPNNVTSVGGLAQLTFHFGTNRLSLIRLFSYKFTQWFGAGTTFKLGFELAKDHPSPAMEIPKGMTASDLEKCDLVELNTLILPRGVQIGTGLVDVAVNSVITKQFAIAPQKSGGTGKPSAGDPEWAKPLEWYLNSIFARPLSEQISTNNTNNRAK